MGRPGGGTQGGVMADGSREHSNLEISEAEGQG